MSFDAGVELGAYAGWNAGWGAGYDAGAESGDLNLDGVDNIQDIIILVNNILNP